MLEHTTSLEKDMDMIVELLQEYQRTAQEAMATDLTDQDWDATRLRGRVIDLLERGGRALAYVNGSNVSPWSAITWTKADPPVALARALGIAHQKLAVAAAESGRDDVLVTMPPPALRRSRPRRRQGAAVTARQLYEFTQGGAA
jgi:hypothetical protein